MSDSLITIGGLLLSFWWIYLPVFLYWLFLIVWLWYRRQKYFKSIEWAILDIKPPKEVGGSPKPFEQIFTGLFGVIGTVETVSDVYLKGLIQQYFSAEIVSIGGDIHFLIRIPKRYRNLAEAQFYAQYPDVEINEFDDYAKNLPADIPNADWDIMGSKIILNKPDPYPIRTYINFLEEGGGELGQIKRFIDPMASLMEIMSKLKDGEQIWVQIICRPADTAWKDEGKILVDKMLGRKAAQKKAGPVIGEITALLEAFFGAFFKLALGQEPVQKKEEKDSEKKLSHGEQDIAKAIEQNITKTGFGVKIQFAYIARREIAARANFGAVFGAFTQYNTLNLNGFKFDNQSITSAKGLFADYKKRQRKMFLYSELRERYFWEKGFVLNVEELATIFHFPATAVAAPMTPRTEAKKAVPPMGLPTE